MEKKLGAVSGEVEIVRVMGSCLADQCDGFSCGHSACVVDFLCSW